MGPCSRMISARHRQYVIYGKPYVIYSLTFPHCIFTPKHMLVLSAASVPRPHTACSLCVRVLS